ncbi:MAG: C-GCAxxG-C-C family protein [Acidobacteriota bacterium]
MRQKAMDIFKQRFHCSQAVLAAAQEKMGMVNEDVVKALGAFGGGIAGSGRVCGCLTGGIAMISSLYSRGNLEGKEDLRMWTASHKLIKKFEELTKEHGSTNCCDIARVNWRDSKAAKEFYSDPESRRKICVQLVGDTAYALGEILEEAADK